MSDEVEIKICNDMAEKELSISQKLFVVDLNPMVGRGLYVNFHHTFLLV